MKDTIPGALEFEGREFLYVESPEDEDFWDLVDAALDENPQIPMPKGGVLEEKINIYLENTGIFTGISYKGDIEAWRNTFIHFCKANNRKYANIHGNEIHI